MNTASYEPLHDAEAMLLAAGWQPRQERSMTTWSHPAYRGAVFSTEGALWAAESKGRKGA